jgi:hypothetical protein
LIFEGELHRTATGKSYRGKGLPGVYEALQKNKISNLAMITNDTFYNSNGEQYRVLHNGCIVFEPRLWKSRVCLEQGRCAQADRKTTTGAHWRIDATPGRADNSKEQDSAGGTSLIFRVGTVWTIRMKRFGMWRLTSSRGAKGRNTQQVSMQTSRQVSPKSYSDGTVRYDCVYLILILSKTRLMNTLISQASWDWGQQL